MQTKQFTFIPLLLAALLSTVAVATPIDPQVRILPGGHSTDIFGTTFGPFSPFIDNLTSVPPIDCSIGSTMYPNSPFDAFCTFDNMNTQQLTFESIALTISGEIFGPSNLLTCDNSINPEAGCQIEGNTITFFGLAIPSSFIADPNSSEWTFEFDEAFDHSISASFQAASEPGSGLLLLTGLAAFALGMRTRQASDCGQSQ